jgi:hypothetical protein
MNPTQLLEAIHAAPFVPFTIRMANDRVFHIDHPELALLAPNRWAVVVVAESGAFAVLALAMMASIEYQPPDPRTAE